MCFEISKQIKQIPSNKAKHLDPLQTMSSTGDQIFKYIRGGIFIQTIALNYLSYTAQAQLPMDGSAHSGRGPSKSINNQENDPWASLRKAILQFEGPYSQICLGLC